MRIFVYLMAALLLTVSRVPYANESAGKAIYPVAIMDFSEKGLSLKGVGEKVSTVVFANLATADGLALVERKELETVVDEAVLNLSGMVSPQQANRIGQLTGARIIITGTVFEIEDQLMIVAKVIGTETGRVLGASVEGHIDDSIVALSKQVAAKIEELVMEKATVLVAAPQAGDERLQTLKQSVAGYDKPSLVVDISERHINRRAVDSAAENAMILFAKELGFEIVDKGSERAAGAKVMIVGQGFSEYAARRGDLLGVKARLELRAIERQSGKILAVDRQTEMEVDVSEISAAKSALARAAGKIAQRMLPKLILQ